MLTRFTVNRCFLRDLSSNQLNGTIPPQLGNLINLQQLYVVIASLSHALLYDFYDPPSIGFKLKRSVLRSHSFIIASGTFPGISSPAAFHLSSETYFSSPICALRDRAPFIFRFLRFFMRFQFCYSCLLMHFCHSLHREIFSNQLSNTIPPQLGNLTKLALLYAQSHIVILDLFYQGFPNLGNHSAFIDVNLKYLVCTHSFILRYLYSNQLIGTIPPQLGNLSQLQSLYA